MYDNSNKIPDEYNIYYEYNLTNNEDLYENVNYYNKSFEDIIDLLRLQHKYAKINKINSCEYA